MDGIFNSLYGLPVEEKKYYIYKGFNMLFKELPYSFPEKYGMTFEQVTCAMTKLELERNNMLDKLSYEFSQNSNAFLNSAAKTHQNKEHALSGSITSSLKDKFKHLKELKVKNPPNPNPGPQQPPGMSKHPGRNRRNRAHKKRAKLNQTNIVLIIIYKLL